MSKNYTAFDVSIENNVAHIVLSRGDKLNTMTPDFWNDLPEIVEGINTSGEARCIVISSTGKHFSAGMDLAVFGGGNPLEHPGADDRYLQTEVFYRNIQKIQASFSCLEDARMPVIMAIHGGCVGGAVDFSCVADFRFATRDAWFSIEEINIGMTADVGTFPRLCRIMPEGWVKQMAYTGERLSAENAHRISFVNELFDTQEAMVARALDVAQTIAEKNPLAITGSKDQKVIAWNLAKRALVVESIEFPGHTRNVGAVNLSADGRYMTSGSDDGTAYVLSKATAADVPYPTDYELSGLRTADVSADIVLHLADDGTLLDSLRLDDVLSTLRIGYGGLQRTNLEGEFDWTHANAVVEHPDGDLLLSLRHQDAIVKVDPVTGALDWILGNHDNWPAELQPYLLAPDASVTWPFHTHGVKVRADGVITLFDNGNFRDTPGPDTDPLEDVETWSRVVGFAVDPIARTVTQAFEHEPEQRTFAYAVGDCDPLSNGHTIGHFGRIIVEDGQYNDDLGRSVTTIRIIEWAPDGTEVWHAHLFNDPAVFPEGWYAYRSERFESFYAYQ